MKKNLVLIGSILGSFVSGCIIVFGIMLGLTTLLGLTGCSMNVAPTEESTQNKIEWIVTDNESRAAETTLDEVTVEVYKAPVRDSKYIFDEKELTDIVTLHRGEILSVPSSKDYNYKFVTYIRVVEFDFIQTFGCDVWNEINFFDYEDTIGMETVHYYGVPIGDEQYKGWKLLGGAVYYDDYVEGYINVYNFLNKMYLEKFYDEHKDGGRIIWDNWM